MRRPAPLTLISLPRPIEFPISYSILLSKPIVSVLLTLDLILLPKLIMFVSLTLLLSAATLRV